MTDLSATEPEESVPAPDPEVAPEPEELVEDQRAEADGQEPAEDAELDGTEEDPEIDEPETVEIEVDGQKYVVPAVLKDGYMQHADYTQKTQDVAAERKALETRQAELVQRAQTQQGQLQDYGELTYTDSLLKQFDEVDWTALDRDDPDQSAVLDRQMRQLQRQRGQIVERIQTRENEAGLQAERETAARKERLTATLARDIPNFSPSVREDLISVATEVGFSREIVEKATDPNVWKVLHLAQLGQEVLKRKKSAAKPVKPQPVKPVSKASGGRSPKPGPHDGMSMDDWAAAERKRTAKKRA